MKVTFPHMGTMWVPLKGMLEHLGVPVIVPPPTSKRTIDLGVSHAPEFACFPLKINIGNFIEAKELGADTLLMAGGVGPCRFGLYGHLEEEILRDLGYEFEALILEPPDKNFLQFIGRLKKLVGAVSLWQVFQSIRIAYYKACTVDRIEKILQEVRAREIVKGTGDKIFQHFLLTIDKARNLSEIDDASGLAKQKLIHVPQDEEKEVIKIGLVGEIYTLLEPFASMDIEKRLGYLGAYVHRSLYLSEWIQNHLLIGFSKNKSYHAIHNAAKPFLNHFIGGHGRESIGAGVKYAQEGFDGIVQVAPLTCMPEIVAHTIFPRVSEHCGIPVMTVYVDEQTGQEGLNTRLEAFIDLLNEKKKNKAAIQ